ncbi:MAG: hypothetical protein LUC94_03540 [Clostridiales bacterium]|nr:hypothetical protein [Clostridiales bacterium]
MDAVGQLKRLMDKNGRNYLHDEPYLVYKELIAIENADASLAGAIPMVLCMMESNAANISKESES